MKIKNVVFDFGGVLIDWDPRYLYRKLFNNESEMEWFLTNICTQEWNAQQDAGRPWATAINTLQSEFPEHSEMIEWFHKGWTEMLNGPIQEHVDLILPIKKNYRVFGLTNWSAETFPIALELYPFLHEFEDIIVSGVEKLIKPDARIYELLLNRNNLMAHECLFLDDNEANIDAAQALGFQTIHISPGINLRERIMIEIRRSLVFRELIES